MTREWGETVGALQVRDSGEAMIYLARKIDSETRQWSQISNAEIVVRAEKIKHILMFDIKGPEKIFRSFYQEWTS